MNSSPKKNKNKMSKGNFDSQDVEQLDDSKRFNMSRDSLAFHDLIQAVCVTKEMNFGQFYEIHE